VPEEKLSNRGVFPKIHLKYYTSLNLPISSLSYFSKTDKYSSQAHWRITQSLPYFLQKLIKRIFGGRRKRMRGLWRIFEEFAIHSE
jgi:hypothetical protein